MFRITTHTERLLAVHDCVAVPRWGGFVLQTVPAVYRKEEHAFAPMCKEVAFNASLQHTDGLLAASYMQAYGVDFGRAQALVEGDVEELKASLARFGKLAFGSIGSFSAGETGQLVFHPGKADVSGAGYYGLAPFRFPALPPIADERTERGGAAERNADVYYIPVSRRVLRGIVASAAAIALLLLISTPVNDVQQAAYTAGFVPVERMITVAETASPAGAGEVAGIAEETVAAEAADATAKPAGEVKKKLFYIVIGSFPTEVSAQTFMAGVSREEFSHVDIVVRDGRYRVYTQVFENRREAEARLDVVRLKEARQSAWLFITR